MNKIEKMQAAHKALVMSQLEYCERGERIASIAGSETPTLMVSSWPPISNLVAFRDWLTECLRDEDAK